MFIHWGVYSQLGKGEWVMQNDKMTVPAYETMAAQFNPVNFDAKTWVSLAKAAGARYITITSRHHDGFAMFATKANHYNIIDFTPFKRDPLKELADECHRQGIKLFFYYSQLDWHHPDYFPRGRTGRFSGRPERGDWNRYIAFMNAQLTELLTNYGPIGGIWFDGMWDKPQANWHLAETYALIHRLQPEALIIPNHHEAPKPGEDVQTFEQDLPGANTAGFNTRTIGGLPLETSYTMNNSWGYNATDTAFKSVDNLVHTLVRAAGNNGNLLLNIGPKPDGTISPEFVERLNAIGAWLRDYGTSIYATNGGPVAPQAWGVTTQRGDTVFVHLLRPQDIKIELPGFRAKVREASVLNGAGAIAVTPDSTGTTLVVPPALDGRPDRVVVLVTSTAPPSSPRH